MGSRARAFPLSISQCQGISDPKHRDPGRQNCPCECRDRQGSAPSWGSTGTHSHLMHPVTHNGHAAHPDQHHTPPASCHMQQHPVNKHTAWCAPSPLPCVGDTRSATPPLPVTQPLRVTRNAPSVERALRVLSTPRHPPGRLTRTPWPPPGWDNSRKQPSPLQQPQPSPAPTATSLVLCGTKGHTSSSVSPPCARSLCPVTSEVSGPGHHLSRLFLTRGPRPFTRSRTPWPRAH